MDYGMLCERVQKINSNFEVFEVCKTKFGRSVFGLKKIVNKNFLTAIIVASVHAREFITTDLVMKMVDDGVFDEIKNFNLIIVPMLNPDGVCLAKHGIGSAPMGERGNLIKINGGSLDFSLFKANGNGVDLNNNFDARFFTNVFSQKRAPSGYPGEFAESENETSALSKLSRESNLFFSISYHSKGEEIYFNFFQNKKYLARDEMIAKRFSQSTGYKIKNPEKFSSGGYKDFCVEKLKIPALTIEVGSDSLTHPIGEQFLPEIYKKHKNIAFDLEYAYNVFKS